MSTEPAEPGIVRAAGGVVWRLAADGTHEVLVVHRPRYGDWSLPKGKVEPGERRRDAALREVWEETGYRCDLGERLGNSPEYVVTDRRGRLRRKRVTWWVMTVRSGPHHEPDGVEIDQIAWRRLDDLDDADGGIDYEDERAMVRRWFTSIGR